MSGDSISRRAFLAQAVTVSGLGVLAPYVSMSFPTGDRQIRLAGTFTLRISTYPALMEINGSVRVEIPGLWFRIVVTRVAEDRFVTVSEVCTHHGCDIGDLDLASMVFTCPCHFSQYAVDGTVVRGPAIRDLDKFVTSWDGGDLVHIEIEDLSSVTNPGGPGTFVSMQTVPGPLWWVEYGIDAAAHLRLAIYSITGEEMMELVDDDVEAGSYRISFDGQSLAPGWYLCRMQTSRGLTRAFKFAVNRH